MSQSDVMGLLFDRVYIILFYLFCVSMKVSYDKFCYCVIFIVVLENNRIIYSITYCVCNTSKLFYV